VGVPQAFQDAFSDGPILDPTVAPTVSATAGDTTYTYDPTNDVVLINKPGQLVPQGYTVYAGLAYYQAISKLNQLLASMGGTAVTSAVLAQHGISDLLPTAGSPQTQAGSGGQGGKPPISPPTAASPQPCSFTPDTPVTTERGKEPIGEVQVGDKVLAYNPKTHKMEDEPVLHVWTHTDHDLVDLTLTTTTPASKDKPATHTSEVLHTTSEHPFFTQEHGFVAAGKLKLGMHVLRADGRVGVITGWKVVPGKQLMYNLEVAQDHTYTVGQGQWVVHNKCDRQELRNNLARTGTLLEGRQAHHIIPCQLESHPLVQKAGFDINSAENGIGLPTTPEMSEADSLPQHLGRHPVYTSRVGRLLDNAHDDLAEEYGNFNNVPVAVTQDALTGIIDSVRNTIIGAGGGCTINDVLLE
jgi:hypothetical protein